MINSKKFVVAISYSRKTYFSEAHPFLTMAEAQAYSEKRKDKRIKNITLISL